MSRHFPFIKRPLSPGQRSGTKMKDVQLKKMSSLMGARICPRLRTGACRRVPQSACVCVCVCVLTPQLAEGENSFACPFTLLPSAAQCSSSHWTKRPHCGIQMKERGGEQCIERTKGLVVGYGG